MEYFSLLIRQEHRYTPGCISMGRKHARGFLNQLPSIMVVASHLTLNTGALMPAVGFGTWQSNGDELEAALNSALKSGYRHIDTAAGYMNEEIVGNVLHEWMSSGRVTREELFIVTKLPPYGNTPEGVDQFVTESLTKLRLDYIDLYLVHCPFGLVQGEEQPLSFDDEGNVVLDLETSHMAIWTALERHVKSGALKAIGLSNFNVEQIEKVWANSEIKPANLQIEMHIHLQQNDLLEYCQEKGIVVTAYSPLGTKSTSEIFRAAGVEKEMPDLLGNPEVQKIAESLGKSPAQILLRFLLEKGVAVIPKSTSEIHIASNIKMFDFELGDEYNEKLEALNQNEDGRIVDFSFFKGVQNHPEFPFQKI